MGEGMFRGKLTMKATSESQGGQGGLRARLFHSGDLGVLHEDGYIDCATAPKTSSSRAAENISTIELERDHNGIRQSPCRVVAKPDENGRDAVRLRGAKPGAAATIEEIMAHCRANSPLQVPRFVVFRDLR